VVVRGRDRPVLGQSYALAVTHNRAWATVTPIGGTCLLLGWAMLLFATLVK